MLQSRTKTDLIIEVWEKLDCESVGAAEISAIETVVLERFGDGAVESPMIIARILADEGAVRSGQARRWRCADERGVPAHDDV